MAKQILSSRSFLFEEETYTEDPKDPERRVRSVGARVRVVASDRPQVVPDWVAETELYNTAIEDGTIMEFVMRKQAVLTTVNNESKASAKQQIAPQAAFADELVGKPDNTQGQTDGLLNKQTANGWDK
jgi:hypothetical protein